MAAQTAETYAITKATQKYLTSKTSKAHFPVKSIEDLNLMENMLKTDGEYRQDVVS